MATKSKASTKKPEADDAKQIQRLSRRNATLEKRLSVSEAKCAQYREQLRFLVASLHSQEELERFAMDEDQTDCLALNQFAGELENMHAGEIRI